MLSVSRSGLTYIQETRPNQVVRPLPLIEKSHSWKGQTDSHNSHTPLMMTDGINTTPNGVFSNRGHNNDPKTVQYGNAQQDFPSLPARKKPPRSYIKETKNTNPVAITNVRKDRFEGVSHLHDNTECVEPFSSTSSQEVFDSYEGNGYLTPTDPPPYVDSCLDYSSADFPSMSSETSTNSIHKRGGRPFQRFDSGVGDCESVQGSSSVRFSTSPTCSTNSVSSPRLSTQYEQQYEDIDQYHRTQEHQHQHHVPQRRSTEKLKTGSVRNGPPQLPPIDISGVTSSDSEDAEAAINSSVAEIIFHPMHDPRMGSLPHTYMPLNTSKYPGDSVQTIKPQRISCWVIVFLILILIISVTALCLSIYTLLSKPDRFEITASEHLGNDSIIGQSDFDSALTSLQLKVDDLIKENAALKEALLHQQNNLTFFIEQKATELSFHQENLSSTLQLMEGRFDAEIANISLTPGPQGPPGVANFSLCVTRSILRSAPASSSAVTETSYLPTDTELLNYFVTFAYCTYEGAIGAHLEMQMDSTIKRYKYRCKCWGQVPSSSQTVCKTIIWMCPDGN